MTNYLGEIKIKIEDSEFKDYKKSDWALYFIGHYGGFDGPWHKDWVLDQVARILNGTKVIIKQASWDNGQSEYRISTDKPSKKYKNWVKDMKAGIDGPDTYGYSIGTPP